MLKSKSTYKYLDFVKFSQLYNWSVQYLNDSKIRFTTKYPLVQIKEFLTRNKTAIAIQDDAYYKRATIKVRNGGIFLRDTVIGSKIGTKNQFVISKGQFLLSKIDARNGAFGVVPEELDGGIITGNFWTFDVDYSKVNPHYLALLTTTNEFIEFCEHASNGTTNRHYLQEPLFLDIKVPLPSLAEQNKLVEEYNEQLTLSENAAGNAELKQSNINKIILECLGVKIVKSNLSKGLSFVSFAELDRWDLSFLQNDAHVKSSYNLVRIADCVDQFMTDEYGYSLRTETSKYPAKKFYYIGMEHIEKSAGELIDMPVVNGAQIKSQTISVPKGYFIYGKLRPYLNKYWYNNTDVKDIICSSELFVFNIKKNIHPRYFEFVLGSDIVQSQISDLVSGARMPRINEKIFMNIQIPLPPINIQEDIVEQIEYNKKEIKSLQLAAATYQIQALTNFEFQIFE
jgi:type I restriction enzyme S subunit